MPPTGVLIENFKFLFAFFPNLFFSCLCFRFLLVVGYVASCFKTCLHFSTGYYTTLIPEILGIFPEICLFVLDEIRRSERDKISLTVYVIRSEVRKLRSKKRSIVRLKILRLRTNCIFYYWKMGSFLRKRVIPESIIYNQIVSLTFTPISFQLAHRINTNIIRSCVDG